MLQYVCNSQGFEIQSLSKNEQVLAVHMSVKVYIGRELKEREAELTPGRQTVDLKG